jgi:hypothetical protein
MGMANIDVTQLLFDLDFVDPVTIVRSVETVGEDGIVSYEEKRYDIWASIQSASGDELLMTPDLARTGGTYEITTVFPLVTATDLTKADTVIWHDVEFVVIAVAKFGNFGGQQEGIMTIKSLSPPQGLR